MALTDDEVRLHPMNTGFEWRARPGPFRRLTEDQAQAYDAVGAFVLEGAFAAAEVADVVAAIDPFEDKVEELLAMVEGGRISIARANEITFTTHLVTVSDRLRAFTSHPVLLDVVHDLIGPDVRLYWDQAVYKKPGTTSPFPWHQDNGYTFVEPQQYLTCWIALTDATVDNGCPWVVPGLHRLGTLAHDETDLGQVCLDDEVARRTAVPVEAPAGSIVVFSSLTPHCTGGNSTDAVRKSYIVQYAPDGAEVVGRSGQARTLAADPDRQFLVLRDGVPA